MAYRPVRASFEKTAPALASFALSISSRNIVHRDGVERLVILSNSRKDKKPMAEDLGGRAQRMLDILGETNIGAAGGALGLAAVSLLTEVSNSDFENWIRALRDARQHETVDRRAARQLRGQITPEAMNGARSEAVRLGTAGRA